LLVPIKALYEQIGMARLTKNFITTSSLTCAKRWAKKLKLKHRQIDVKEQGKKPYVLKGSWL
jgi:hypothetical protein